MNSFRVELENIESNLKVKREEYDKINENEPVATIESDKSSVEIPSIFSGTIEKIEIKVGDKGVIEDDEIKIEGDQFEVTTEQMTFNEYIYKRAKSYRAGRINSFSNVFVAEV